MSLSEPAAVLVGAIITGLPTGAAALAALVRDRPNSRSRRLREQTARQQMAEELSAQYKSEIAYLRKQVASEHGEHHDD